MAARKREYRTQNYLSKAYRRDETTKLIKRAVKKLTKFQKENPFDAIAFRGYSGAPIAAILSWELNLPMIAVRKNTVSSHDYLDVFGPTDVESYIIVDDFISSGGTVRDIIKGIQMFVGEYNEGQRVNLAGVFCYAAATYKPRKLKDWGMFSGGPYQDVPVLYL